MPASKDHDFVFRTSLSYFNPDELLDVVNGAQLVHRLTGGPNFRAHLSHIRSDGFAFDCGAYTVPVFVEGTFAPDAICLGVMLAADRPTIVNGLRLPACEFQVYPERSDLEYNAGSNSTWAACLLTREELQKTAAALLGRQLSLTRHGVESLRPTEPAFDAIVEAIQDMLALTSVPDCAATRLDHFRKNVVSAYVRAISTAEGNEAEMPPPCSSPSRRRIAERVRDWIESKLNEPYCSREVCEVAGYSERYVELVFRERYESSPKRWHFVQRLNQVRVDLLNGEARNGGITGVATRRAFYELGRFATSYRKMFGECPSETAKRCKDKVD